MRFTPLKNKSAHNTCIATSGAEHYNISYVLLSAAVSTDEKSQENVLNFINKIKPGGSSGLTVIKYPTCSNTDRWAKL
jgi:bifunctional pyridoxal-dependent enzyme with beta-cystathionase and maltose regulon repressor activities